VPPAFADGVLEIVLAILQQDEGADRPERGVREPGEGGGDPRGEHVFVH
jgi:hypothetical protein